MDGVSGVAEIQESTWVDKVETAETANGLSPVALGRAWRHEASYWLAKTACQEVAAGTGSVQVAENTTTITSQGNTLWVQDILMQHSQAKASARYG